MPDPPHGDDTAEPLLLSIRRRQPEQCVALAVIVVADTVSHSDRHRRGHAMAVL
jgi:hypothetical protein